MDQRTKSVLLVILLLIILISLYTMIKFRSLRKNFIDDPTNKKAEKLIRTYTILMVVMLLCLVIITMYVVMRLKL